MHNAIHKKLQKQTKQYDVYGVGNAIVDLLVSVDDIFLNEISLPKGHMTLASSREQAFLLNLIEKKDIQMVSGGSAANTMIAMVKAGGNAFYTGKIARDPYGEYYRVNLLEAGVHFDVHPVEESEGSTATCIVFVTPDAERTMSTHLGASILLNEKDIKKDRIYDSRLLYIEGYLWTNESTQKAAKKAIEMAKSNHIPVSFTFSDSFVVEQNRDEFMHLLKELVFDIVFMNSEEAKSFTKQNNLDSALKNLKNFPALLYVTNNKDGAFVIYEKTIRKVPGFPVKPLDTTGAGDCFAGGVLFGLTHGYTPEISAKIGNFLASEIVQIHGARLQNNYQDTIIQKFKND